MTKQTGYKEGIQLGDHFTEWPGGCRIQDAVDINLTSHGEVKMLVAWVFGP